jgi:hypothetical protein
MKTTALNIVIAERKKFEIEHSDYGLLPYAMEASVELSELASKAEKITELNIIAEKLYFELYKHMHRYPHIHGKLPEKDAEDALTSYLEWTYLPKK